jgi:Flp pilus assembly protein TadD
MSTDTDPLYQEATALAEAGQFQEAYDLYQLYLEEHPDDPEALNDTAVVLHCMHRSGEGIDYLIRARGIAGDSPEIVWNLAEALLAEARALEARPLLPIMAEHETITADILNRAARILVDQKELDAATELLSWSLDLCPDQELLRPMIQIIESKKPGFVSPKPAETTRSGIPPP